MNWKPPDIDEFILNVAGLSFKPMSGGIGALIRDNKGQVFAAVFERVYDFPPVEETTSVLVTALLSAVLWKVRIEVWWQLLIVVIAEDCLLLNDHRKQIMDFLRMILGNK